MARIGRYNLSEISVRRILSALKMRIQEFPHSLSWRTSLFARINKNKLEKFREIHKGERCFVVANGPSLKKTNLDLLRGELTFGLNRI
jgi:hypothetical protein